MQGATYKIDIPITVKDNYSRELKKIERVIKRLQKAATIKVKVDADTKPAERQINQIGRRANAPIIQVTANTSRAESRIQRLVNQTGRSRVVIGAEDQVSSTVSRANGALARMGRSRVVRVAAVLRDNASAGLGKIKSLATSIPSMITIGLGAVGASKLTSAIKSATEAGMHEETATVTIGAMLQDEKKSKAYMTFMKNMAQKSPVLDYGQMMDGSKSLIAQTKNLDELKGSWATVEKLQALDPSQGTDGAIFALKEMFSGDAVSLVERFGFRKAWANEVKNLAVPEQIKKFEEELNRMGISDGTVDAIANTAQGQLQQIKETAQDMQRGIGSGLLEGLKPGLQMVNGWFDNNAKQWDKMVSMGRQIGQATSSWTMDKLLGQAKKLEGTFDAIKKASDIFYDYNSGDVNLEPGFKLDPTKGRDRDLLNPLNPKELLKNKDLLQATYEDQWIALQKRREELLKEGRNVSSIIPHPTKEGYAVDLAGDMKEQFAKPIPISFEAKFDEGYSMVKDAVMKDLEGIDVSKLGADLGEKLATGLISALETGIPTALKGIGKLLKESISNAFENPSLGSIGALGAIGLGSIGALGKIFSPLIGLFNGVRGVGNALFGGGRGGSGDGCGCGFGGGRGGRGGRNSGSRSIFTREGRENRRYDRQQRRAYREHNNRATYNRYNRRDPINAQAEMEQARRYSQGGGSGRRGSGRQGFNPNASPDFGTRAGSGRRPTGGPSNLGFASGGGSLGLRGMGGGWLKGIKGVAGKIPYANIAIGALDFASGWDDAANIMAKSNDNLTMMDKSLAGAAQIVDGFTFGLVPAESVVDTLSSDAKMRRNQLDANQRANTEEIKARQMQLDALTESARSVNPNMQSEVQQMQKEAAKTIEQYSNKKGKMTEQELESYVKAAQINNAINDANKEVESETQRIARIKKEIADRGNDELKKNDPVEQKEQKMEQMEAMKFNAMEQEFMSNLQSAIEMTFEPMIQGGEEIGMALAEASDGFALINESVTAMDQAFLEGSTMVEAQVTMLNDLFADTLTSVQMFNQGFESGGEMIGNQLETFQTLMSDTLTSVQMLNASLTGAEMVGHQLETFQALMAQALPGISIMSTGFETTGSSLEMLNSNIDNANMVITHGNGQMAVAFDGIGTGATMVVTNLNALSVHLGQASATMSASFAPIPGAASLVVTNLNALASQAGTAAGYFGAFSAIPGGVSAVTSALSGLAARISAVQVQSSISFGGGGGPVKAYAKGGIATSPHVGLVAEAGVPETMIPWDGSSRSKSLWMTTGHALGMFDGKSAHSSNPVDTSTTSISSTTSGPGGGISISVPLTVVRGQNIDEIIEKAKEEVAREIRRSLETTV